MKYSKTKIKKVLALRERNMTYAEIAKTVGVSIPTIGNWLRSHSKTKEYAEIGYTSKEIKGAIRALRTFRAALAHI